MARRAIHKASNIFQRVFRRRYACLSERLGDIKHPIQSYRSTSTDPYLNLSIEHHLLQTSHPDTTILFLYINRPCIVIGRNQNPWYEVNLGMLQDSRAGHPEETDAPNIGNVDLVRRRSGGGTVFHDEGNVNWTVICPPSSFTRDRHAEMVVRALRKQGIERARVNERHDIVLDQGARETSSGYQSDPSDLHTTPYSHASQAFSRPLKVSGSAYKLTRLRALHHGTCLLQSPNLHAIPRYLRSPVKPYIKTRGVESVSSPVTNIGLSTDIFAAMVQQQFAEMYGADRLEHVQIGKEQLHLSDVRKGYDELRTPDWTYCQTPQFTLSTVPESVALNPRAMPHQVTVSVKHGTILDIDVHSNSQELLREAATIPRVKLTELRQKLQMSKSASGTIGHWLTASLAV
ncbi:hypothetical protein EJ05DRAFT_301767 [Pseudovirgaria hyperparasitica]|uniref:Putative lipoate-protein ligase A n=1 Tax=Pseudovirgaria hyperparasitica TaxID=470096 RepID=A0A6A6WBX7_9PEZI|nr:uncharacterized protein EJ05DRAFT_301767 [Pseudovirgaria hyperparasitica]KAF2759544.1 hypothetical protein EJ05DRAFT_301767 [Pseudovirgaria hyperparasitica]